jgi:hypothetical protein
MEESINNPEPPALATTATNNQPKEADPLWPEAGKTQFIHCLSSRITKMCL